MIFDMHIHTSESSPCGQICGDKVVEYYKKAGYDGIVITDHFTNGLMNAFECDFDEYCRIHEKGFLNAKKKGDEIGLTVLYGIELRLNKSGNDYLCYGLTNEFLRNHPDIFSWGIDDLKKAAQANGFIFYQAHPFRNGMTIVDPGDLFGIEVFNGKPSVDDRQRNSICNLWAEKFGLLKIAGSDCHSVDQLGTAGVLFYDEILDNNSLVDALKKQSYMLVERANPRQMITC